MQPRGIADEPGCAKFVPNLKGERTTRPQGEKGR